jgi:DNA-binding beta-propeller fold protein YncE
MKAARSTLAAAFMSGAALLAGCSGGGGSHALPSAPGTRVQFSIKWPSVQTLSHLRRPLYISPSTMSVAVEVNDDASLTTIANNPNSGQGGTQTVQVNAPPGNDKFYITLWDKQDGQGNQLGQAVLSKTIVAAQVNSITATVEGVLAKIAVTHAAQEPFFEQLSDEGGTPFFTLVGNHTGTVALSPLDADGNVILGDGGVGPLSLESSDPAITLTPVSGTADEYTVQRTGDVGPGTHATLVASATDGNGNPTTTRYPLHVSASMYVAFENAGSGSIATLDQGGNVISTSGHFSGVVDPKAISYDADDRLIFVADAGANAVLAYDEDGNAAANCAPMSVNGASGVAYNPVTKLVYVTSSTQNTVTVFTPAGAPVAASGFSGLQSPNGIAALSGGFSSGQLVVTSSVNGQAPQLFNPDGTSASSLPQDPALTSNSVAYDADSDQIWITSTGSGGQLTAYSPFGWSVYSYTSLTQPTGVAYNPIAGELFAADASTGAISAFANQYPFSQDSAVDIHVSGSSMPSAITFAY